MRIYRQPRDEIGGMRDASATTIARIVIVSSLVSFLSRMRSVFSSSEFLVRQICDATQMLNVLREFQPNLAVVEFAAWPDVRRALFQVNRGMNSPPPTLVLSAYRGSAEKAAALNDGADAHATTSATADALRAEVRALIRRSQMAPMAIRVGTIDIDTVHREVRSVTARVELSPSECSLLHFIMARAGSTVPRRMVQEYLGRFGRPCSDDACKQVVRSVRRKLERIGAGGYLVTVIGTGYRFDV
jgi:DNA-binding response OmpR family regulator